MDQRHYEAHMDLHTGKLSLSDRTAVEIRDVLGGRSRGWRSAALFAGPAVIASIAYMDPGNFATNIQAGAQYGYTLLWVVLMANLIAMLFQALSAKLGIVTGRNLAEMCREQFATPLVLGMWVVSEIAAMATDLAEFLGGAIGLSLLFHMPLMVGMVITAIVTYGILLIEGRGFRPMMMKAGIIVTTRRTQTGMRKPTKPCMIIWPAMVPTTELEMPEAIRETRKTPAAPMPSSGVSV
jgi:manganese transport protein